MPNLDGTGMKAPSKGAQGLEAFEDAKPQAPGPGAGAGDGGTGPKVVSSRTSDIKGSKRKST